MLGPTIGCLSVLARPSLALLTPPSARKKSGRARVQLEQEDRMGSEIILRSKIFAPSELPNEGKRRRSVRRTARDGSARAQGRQLSSLGVKSLGV